MSDPSREIIRTVSRYVAVDADRLNAFLEVMRLCGYSLQQVAPPSDSGEPKV